VPADAGRPPESFSIAFGPARLHFALVASDMSYQKSILATVALTLIIGTLGCWVLLTRPLPSKVTLSFIGYSTNSSGQTLASFAFTNGSKYSVVALDSCCIQSKVANNFTNIRLRDIRLPPGHSETISVLPPAGQRPWRLGISQYPEDPENKLKIAYDGKPWVRRFIPLRLQAWDAPSVWSAWLSNDERAN
jgi:hypothetical protein